MERIRRGLELVRASWEVVRADREMLLLPILSALSTIAVLALTFFGLFADDLRAVRAGEALATPTTGEYIVLAIATYVVTYLAIFFNVALICAAHERMSGGDPTLRSALGDAMSHASAIAPWALISMIVSTVLRAIEERAGVVGKIAAGLLGLAWALITYLVLPVLVIERLGVRDAISRSKDLFVQTWGETVSGDIGMSIIGFLAIIVALPVLLLIGGGGQPVMIIFAIALGVIWFMVVATVMSALSAVFRVALYRFAADGETPDGFAHLDLGGVFPEKRRGLFGRTA